MVTRLSTAGDGFENGVHIVGVQGKPTESISVEKEIFEFLIPCLSSSTWKIL
jgi:hypothetical protein